MKVKGNMNFIIHIRKFKITKGTPNPPQARSWFMNEIFFSLSCDINLVCIFVKSECTAGDGARHEQNGDYVFDGYLWQRVCMDGIYSLWGWSWTLWLKKSVRVSDSSLNQTKNWYPNNWERVLAKVNENLSKEGHFYHC